MSHTLFNTSLSYSLLQALSDVNSSFTGETGSYELSSEDGLILAKKTSALAIKTIPDQTSTPQLPAKQSPNPIIGTIVRELNDEIDKVLAVVSKELMIGHVVQFSGFAITQIALENLDRLEKASESGELKLQIESLKLRILKFKENKHFDLELYQGIKSNNLDLALWALKNGADPKILDEHFQEGGLSIKHITWLKLVAEDRDFSPENLDHHALKIGFGYKTTNLKIMEARLEQAATGLKKAKISIPKPLGISDTEMWNFLSQGIPSLQELWKEFQDSFDEEAKTAFMSAESNTVAQEIPLPITARGEVVLGKIDRLIVEYFARNPYESLVLKQWLDKEKPDFLIIRSTGKEDSTTIANAGGNASIPFVRPEVGEISKAIGDVLASYFGRKSIVQRLQTGDRSVFNEEPFIPVLVQEMIAEPSMGGKHSKPSDIPRSGVLFTRQPGRAEDVVVINTALGANEGVVSSQVTVDTYCVHPSGVYSTIRNKGSRFVQSENTDGSITLGPVKNTDAALREQPAIDEELAKDLALLARNYAVMYGTGEVVPMDMEYTITYELKETSPSHSELIPIIHPLQIRPLLSKATLDPSYLKLSGIQDIKAEHQVHTSTLLAGDCSAREIHDMNSEVLFADDLPQALDKFQHMADPTKIRLIITRKTAPLTSHEAVTFANKSIPILPIENPEHYRKARQILAKSTGSHPCLADPQRGLIIYGEGKHATDLVQPGLISYPTPREYSLPKSRGTSCLDPGLSSEERGERLANLFATAAKRFNKEFSNEQHEALFARLNQASTQEILEIIATSENPDASLALIYLVYRRLLISSLDKHKELLVEQIVRGDPELADDNLKAAIRVYEELVYLTVNNTLPAILKHPPNSMGRLFHLKPIESLIFQDPSINISESLSIKGGLAMRSAYPVLQDIHEKHGLPMSREHTWLVYIGRYGYRKELREHWYQFCAKLDEGQKRMLIESVKTLQTLHMEELFINVFFQEKWNDLNGNPSEIYNELMRTIASEAVTLGYLQEQETLLTALENQEGNWGTPSFSEKNLPLFEEKLVQLGIIAKPQKASLEFKRMYQKSSPFARLALISYAQRIVTCCDNSIKSISGSSLFENDTKKAAAFATMLKPYEAMMETLMSLSPRAERALMGNDEGEVPLSFRDYIIGIKSGRVYLHQDLFEFRDRLITYDDWKEGQPSKYIPVQGPGTEFFESRGFLQICTDLEAANLSEEKATKQFEAQKHFNVDIFVPGSKIDRINKVYWPSRLEEYFTTFHQTMEVMTRHELQANGISSSLLPSFPVKIVPRYIATI